MFLIKASTLAAITALLVCSTLASPAATQAPIQSATPQPQQYSPTTHPVFPTEEVAAYQPKGPTDCFRHICLEYNSPCRPEFAAGNFFDPDNLYEYFSQADPVAYAKFCQAIHLDGVLLLAVPEGGYTTYLQTRVGQPYPYLKEHDFDFFGQVIRECQVRNMSVFGYICIGWNKKAQRDFADEFPPQHGGNGFEVPTLNGAFAEQVIEYAREILKYYPVDGLRTDILDHNTATRLPGDKSLYRQLYGEDMPDQYPSWQREQHFRLASISRFVRRFYQACKETKPAVEIWHNWFNYKNVVDLRDTDVVDISYEEFADPFSTLFVQGIFGSEAMISGKLLQNPQRRLCLVLNGRAYDYFPVNKKTALIDQPLIDLFQAGKGYYGAGSARWVPSGMDWFFDNLAPFYAEVAAQEPYLQHAKPASRVAVVYSEASRFRLPGWQRGPLIDPLEKLTCHFLVQNEPLEFIAAHHLPIRDDLNQFRLILVPEMTGFTPDQQQQLVRYARSGGTLLLTGVATLFDEQGRQRADFALADHLGLHFQRLLDASQQPLDTWLWRNTDFDGQAATLDVNRAGTLQLHLWMREANVALDQVVLTKDAKWRPPADALAAGNLPDGLVLLEPESSTDRLTRQDRHWDLADDLTGFSGKGYVVSRGKPHMEKSGYAETSAQLSLPAKLEQPGVYYVWLRFYAKDGLSDSVFMGVPEGPQVALDLDAVHQHQRNLPASTDTFAVEPSPRWSEIDYGSVQQASLVAATPARGRTAVSFTCRGRTWPLIHLRRLEQGRLVYLATNDLTELTAAMIQHLIGPSPVTVVPTEKHAYLTRQHYMNRYVLHLMDAGDCTVTVHPDLARLTQAVEQFPAQGWTYELETTPQGLRVRVFGAAQNRLLVLQ